MEFLTTIATQGVLGVLVVVLSLVVKRLYDRVQELSERLVTDAQKSRDVVIEPLREMSSVLKENTNVLHTIIATPPRKDV